MPRPSVGIATRSLKLLLLNVSIVVVTLACAQGGGREESPAPAAAHPRLWLTQDDLPRLRSWAVSSNPLYRDGLALLAEEAKADMDAGLVPAEDGGDVTWEQYPAEMYAQLFAFMSLVEPDPALREDYARRARELLMYVMNEAARGPADEEPFRDPRFSTDDRSRWWGEAFALTTDWIYRYLSAADKATIRRVFLRWSEENLHAEVTNNNHPEPIGVVNDPVLVSDPTTVRWAGNNYYTAHMRNIGLMALALDPADDPGGELRSYLANATGAWLYVVDHLLRNDARGGLAPEGFEYSPQSLGYVAQFLLALRTAGEDDARDWGRQVVLTDNPFWREMVPAYLHSLSPVPVLIEEIEWLGEVYQPAWYGDGQEYFAADPIEAFGPLGLYYRGVGDSESLEAIRWLAAHTAPGGADRLPDRVADANAFRDAILYFMLFDPEVKPAADPRPGMPRRHFAPGLGRLLARSDWSGEASWFSYALGWISVDHQHADGNQFEFYRRGEWLTKERTGYGDNIGASDYHNTLGLENDRPDHHDPSDYRHGLWQRGSQWLYGGTSGDGRLLALSLGERFVYALGDATELYNSEYENATDIVHASRSIVWLEPDHVVVFDRAASRTAGRFKRFWLNLPAPATISDRRAAVTTPLGQRLFVTTVLPADALIASEEAEPLEAEDEPANFEPMTHRLRVEAPGGPREARFLHVLQGADAGEGADPVALVESEDAGFVGVQVAGTIVLFPVEVETPVTGLDYLAPADVGRHLVTGLTPGAGYRVTIEEAGESRRVEIGSGDTHRADDGGVLLLSF